MDEVAGDFSEKVYYEDYDCEFWSCASENKPLFFVSEKAKNYWMNNFYLFLLISLILFGIMFFLAWNFYKAPIVAGGIMILVSFLIIKIDSILISFMDAFVVNFFYLFFITSKSVFLWFFVAGIILLATGILLAIFGTTLFNRLFQGKDEKQ